ncbi:MAG: hypothetical protein LBL25_01835 [Oscillospiraceae bacterium]|jgi:hypothetical protein|nr:hypothetical protein [Oscillospiraceae bacterium]
MKKHSFFVTLICAAALICAVAAIIIAFREEICGFIAALRRKLDALKAEVLPPDEYGDYADVE